MIQIAGFGLTALGFLLLGGGLLLFGGRTVQGRLLATAILVHGLWALSQMPFAFAMRAGIETFLLPAHYGLWAIFFAALFPDRRQGLPALVFRAVPILLIAKILLMAGVIWLQGLIALLALQGNFIVDLAMVVTAMAATIGVFQAAGESERWVIKFLVFPLGLLLVYDLFLYTLSLAGAPPSPGYIGIRGLLNLLTVPLVFIAALRHKFWRRSFMVSRQAALYSLTLIGAGLYLMLAAVAAYAIRAIDPKMAPELLTVLLFGAALLLLFLLSSGSVRAKIKNLIRRHFYARKYDYAHEWREFMYTIAREEGEAPIGNRVIRAIADRLETPGGALFALEDGRLRLEATWNMRIAREALDGFDPGLLLNEAGEPRCLYGEALEKLGFPAEADIRLIAPLPHGTRLWGLLVLSSPRVRQNFDEEDEELVLLVARQCASFLSESNAVSALEENRQFARFNRQYAFVAHDVKNILSQLMVMLRNFERHAADPEFQRDMFETISNSVERLQKMMQRLARIAEGGGGADDSTDVVLAPILREVAEGHKARGQDVRLDLPDRDIMVRCAPDRLMAVVEHLVANAIEAGGPDVSVRIGLREQGGRAVIEIEDDGPGMSAEFIRDRLFRPFKSTKLSGFGVGAYQCREFAREHGGDLDAISSPGSGTTMRLTLPLIVRAKE
ncbi:MAG: PEP-CTERM system histidine kinase PrsK [Rhodothalassiaceae bacterium]